MLGAARSAGQRDIPGAASAFNLKALELASETGETLQHFFANFPQILGSIGVVEIGVLHLKKGTARQCLTRKGDILIIVTLSGNIRK